MRYFAVFVLIVFLNGLFNLGSAESDKSNDWLKNENKTNLATHRNLYLLAKNECGQVSIGGRISNGVHARRNEFPWMALIFSKTEKGYKPKCAGTVISERYVLTAAHCVNNTSLKIKIRLGEHHTRNRNDCDQAGNCSPPVQNLSVNKIIVHPQFGYPRGANDIALIRLKKAANFTQSNIKPICLSIDTFEHLLSRDPVSLGIVAGWGVTEKGKRSPILNKKSVFIHPLETCQKFFTRSITEKQICARGYEGMNICSGDSGGPLQYITTIEDVQKYVQVGIISFGPAKCKLNRASPAVYTKVTAYMAWILDNLEA